MHRMICSAALTLGFLLVINVPSRAYDNTTSRFWKNLKSGIAQKLVLDGTSLSHPQYAPWDTMLKGYLAAEIDTAKLTVVNISPAGGNWSQTGADSIETLIAQKPDAVFLEFASNDAVNRLDCTIDGCARPAWTTMITTIRWRLPQCAIFLYITSRPWDMLSCGTTPCRICTIFEAQYCRRSARASNNDTVEQYFDMVRSLADTYATHRIDTYGQFKARFLQGTQIYVSYVYDGHHPTVLACNEIILPTMLQALKGQPLSITSPRPGDSLRIGSNVTVSWTYDPDSVSRLYLNISTDSGRTWLPFSAAAFNASAGSATLPVPARIDTIPLAGKRVFLNLQQYDSNIGDKTGPLRVIAGNGITMNPQDLRNRTVEKSLVGQVFMVSERNGRLRATAGGRLFSIRGRRLTGSDFHIFGPLVVERAR